MRLAQRLLLIVSSAKSLISQVKPYLRWLILGGTLFFLAHALRQHWQEVAAIRVDATGWLYLAIALLVTLLAHIWAGWVWGWILQELDHPNPGLWSILAYLKTNIAKYLPGNVWHFYGRVMAAKSVGVPLEAAAVSVVMEPLLMAIAALIVAFISNQQLNLGLQAAGLGVGLALVHPRVMNPLLKKLAAAKTRLRPTRQANTQSVSTLSTPPSSPPPSPSPPSTPHPSTSPSPHPIPPHPRLRRYPLLPLLGELLFLGLRGAGFIVALMALQPVEPSQILSLVSAFSLAWMLGLVIPGAPGGIGVFEATALALLDGLVPSGILLGGVAFYRLVSTAAEAIGAGLAYWIEPNSTSS